MSRSLDPAFHELRTKPLPTLPQRRRLIRERLAREQAHLDQFARLAAPEHLTAAAAARARNNVRIAATNVRMLQKALAYLGEPDARLDLYRLFGMDLPPDVPAKPALRVPVQLELFAGMPPLSARGPPRRKRRK
jgi:hypothetical protein